MSDYFYDGQTRRYIAQFLRVFSDLKYRTDPDENGLVIESRVPIKYGDMSRMAASIINNNSENIAMPIPSMSGYVTALKMDDTRRYDTTLISKVQVNEVEQKSATEYGTKVGNSYTVERYMPVPYIMTMKLDILTSNTSTKLQLLEQIIVLFNPMIELQQNENPLDWTRIFYVILKNTNWSNRTIPLGDNIDYDVSSLEFELPIWISPPAKQKRQRIIKNIVTRVFDNVNCGNDFSSANIMARINITSENLQLEVTLNADKTTYSGQLLNSVGSISQDTTWANKMLKVGTITPNVTKIKLSLSADPDDDSGDIYGNVVEIDPTDPTKIIFTIDSDTLPTTISKSPVTAIINPRLTYPCNGIDTLNTSITHRYLLQGDIDSNDPVIIGANRTWGFMVAKNNDIIEYSLGTWGLVFDSSTAAENQYVTNLSDGNHYRYDGVEWVYTILGTFNPTYWALTDITPIN